MRLHRAHRATRTPPTAETVCDHTMAALLIRNPAGDVLLVEGRDGAGMAPPATHVTDYVAPPGPDRHTAWIKAADQHTTEITNLTADTSATALALDQWDDLPCDRPTRPGARLGHRWVIVAGGATGELFPNPDYTRGAAWYTPAALQVLAGRTLDWARGGIPDHEIRYLPGLAPVWVWWLHQLGHLPTITSADAFTVLAHAAAIAGAPDPYRADTMTVTVRDRASESPWGSGMTSPRTKVVTISAYCQAPGCRARRGTPRGLNDIDDGARFWVQVWDNPCGHIDMYAQVMVEARERLRRRSGGKWRRDGTPTSPAMTDQNMDLVIAGVRACRNPHYSEVLSQTDDEVRLRLRVDGDRDQVAVFTWHPPTATTPGKVTS